MLTTSVISMCMEPIDSSSIVRIVFHPATGNGKALMRAREVAAALKEHGIGFELVDTSIAEGSEIPALPNSYRALIIVGGDGLIHRMIPQMIHSTVPVGIMPAGSGNDFWRMAGHRHRDQSLEKIINYCVAGAATTSVDVIQLEFEQIADQSPKYAIGAISWGAEARINAAANALPRQLGSFRYILGLLLTVPKLKGFHTTIQCGSYRFDGAALVASIANIRSLGGGIKLFPQADFSDGKLELSLVQGSRLMPVLPLVPKILVGANHRRKVSHVLSQAQIRTQEDCYADGEFVGTGNFGVKVLPGAIKLIC